MTTSVVRKVAPAVTMSQAQRASRAVAKPDPDPYLELELYLEKVNEEIGKVFDQCFTEDNAFGNDIEQNDYAYDETDGKGSVCEDRMSDTLSLDAALQDAIEIIAVNDYCGGVHTATQTSPTMSQSSSPIWISDCSSSFALHTSSSSSEHGDGDGEADDDRDDNDNDTSSLDNVAQQDIISSDSELLPRLRHSQFRSNKKRKDNLELMHCYGSSGYCENADPVWVLRQDVKVQRRQRDRRGVVFDEQAKWMASAQDGLNGLDKSNASSSAHSLPLHHVPASSPSYDRVSYLLIADLGNKSSSAPVLKKSDSSSEQLSSHRSKVTKQPRSQSDRHLAEIQAAEACKWLRAAGFPQYAQMYEDHQFPIDLSSVQKDNPFLDFDSWQSLFRRLDTLNRCANIKVDSWRSSQMDDSDADENQCALSENWTFQHDQRRWSRCRGNEPLQPLQNITPAHDYSENSKQEQKESSTLSGSSACTNTSSVTDPSNSMEDTNFARSGSERIRDGAKAFLRRVESLKSRRRKRQNREGIVISGPQVADMLSMQQRIKDLNCLEISSPALSVENSFEFNSPQSSPLPCSPVPSPRRPLISVPLFPLMSSDLPMRKALVNRRGSVSFDRAKEVVEAMSDSECQRFHRKFKHFNNSRLGKPNQELIHRSLDKSEQSIVHSSDYDSDVEEIEMSNPSRASWHSLQRGSLAYSRLEGSFISCLTCGQLQVLRKLALLKLTALIEKHCPTHKTGWNWELPKFIRKIKTPDYRDKLVFGVPLSVVLQRSGQPLPKCVREALCWLRQHAVDQVGIFRKSGVRSRIQMLKTTLETTKTGYLSYDEQQAYDVADMVKQYFRELPEALLTTKLSETLILIFQYVPVALRGEAVSYVLLLMPNEHCEVLQILLEFLQYISEHSSVNQMNASNLALCFAPSLFYFNQNLTVCNGTRQNSVSPRRRKPTGVPDPKELSENKAAHDCLLYLIKNYCTLFTVSKDMLTQCNFSDMDESKPLSLTELGTDQHQDWRGYLSQCQSALLKESKEKSRGWVNVSNGHGAEVEVAYKKVGDGHPLRLWRVATEVEAPPREVLHRVLRERHIWDPSVTKMRVVERLDEQSEVFQYVCGESTPPMVSRDYSVLRTWRMDLARGACAIVETSVEHENAEIVVSNSVRAIVLASRYLIEPCGSGKSRLMHLSRVDTMGRTPEWYNKNYGHMCRLHLANIRSSFKHSAAGPESKV